MERICDIFYYLRNKNEYYYSFDNINFNKEIGISSDYFKYINLISEEWNDICILSLFNNKIYRKNNYLENGLFSYSNNNSINVIWEKYGNEEFILLGENNYYSNKYIEKFIKKIYIDFVLYNYDTFSFIIYNNDFSQIYHSNIKNDIGENLFTIINNFTKYFYYLSSWNNIMIYTSDRKMFYNYINTNIITDKMLLIFKDCIYYNFNKYNWNYQIYNKNNDFLNEIILNNYLKLVYKKDKDGYKIYDEYEFNDFELINNNSNNLFIIIHNNSIYDIIDKIDYLSSKYNIIIFDHIINKKNNNINYYKFIYYSNLDDKFNEIFLNINQKILIYVYSNNNYYFYQKFNNTNFKVFYYQKYDIELFDEFNNNEFNNNLQIKYDFIPKILHFIWLDYGNIEIPDIYINYINTWKSYHPDFKVIIWHKNNINFTLINQNIYNNVDKNAMKADILRYEIIYKYGGIYIDCDFLCIKNINDLIINKNNMLVYESDEYITNAIFGFSKEHPFLLKVIKNLQYNFSIYKNVTKINKYIPKISGPEFFTEVWKNTYFYDFIYDFNILDKNIFYSYSYQNNYYGNDFTIYNDKQYGIHLWGNSWNKNLQNNSNEFIETETKLILSNVFNKNFNEDFNNNQKFNEKFNNNKINIIHIIGYFFSGGIEKLIYYFDKYGNHEKYNYYFLCHDIVYNNENNENNDNNENNNNNNNNNDNNDNNDNNENNDKKLYYNIENKKLISFNGNQKLLNKYIKLINPDLIIDHYSIYIDWTLVNDIYKDINKNIVIQFMHTAILYQKDITNYNIHNSIHLYKEPNLHISWSNIKNNYYTTLGFDNKDVNPNNFNNNNKKINIAIVGRIAEEKLPLDLLKELIELLRNNKKLCINIYGELDNLFSINYVNEFKLIMNNLKQLNENGENIDINYHGFIQNINYVYSYNNLLLIPSLYETGSFVAIEALGHSLPIIGRNCQGLKNIIKNDFNGILFNDNQECIQILNKLTKKKLNNIKTNIQNDIFKYDIKNVIKNIENNIFDDIIDKRKNLIIITSILNCTNNPLSYCSKRSIFSFKTRFKQTINSINSIKKYIHNPHIVILDASNMTMHSNEENILRELVDEYYNFWSDDDNNIDNKLFRNAIEGEYKGLGEAMILLKGLKNIINNQYKNIYKLSGRYYLNDTFDFKQFDNLTYNIFSTWDNCSYSLCTIFYKICYKDINYYITILEKMLKELEKGNGIELCMFKYFIKNKKIINSLGVSGYLSTEGYFFSV